MRYTLPEPVDFDRLDEIIEGDVAVDAFSQLVATASDHFKFRVSDFALATGVVGSDALTITFGKLGHTAAPRDREWVEEAISEAYGSVVITADAAQ